MLRASGAPWRLWDRSWFIALATVIIVGLLAAFPAPLIPLARVYRDLCDRYPVLAVLTNHLPPLPVALLLGLTAVALINGGAVGITQFRRTLRFNRRLDDRASQVPPRLGLAGARLGLGDRLIYLDEPRLAACCYGFVRPRVAVTADLLAHLDDAELIAVLAHERHHLQRRDPARYLAIHALAAAAFMFPVAAAIRHHLETRVEIAADRAALAVASRGALAGALLSALAGAEAPIVGVAGLSATEARIAHLAGRQAVPPIPLRPAIVSLAVLGVIVAGAVNLATSAHFVRMICPLCPWA